MMKLIRRIDGVLFLAMVLVTPGPAQAAESNGWYYPTPSWDQQLQCDTQATCPRFIVLSNWIDTSSSGGAAVLDRETGLVWETSPAVSTFTWDLAQTRCTQLELGHRLGWRVPTVQELASLVDPTVPYPGPTLPAGHPFRHVQTFGEPAYWSATTLFISTAGLGGAWAVDFRGGGVVGEGKGNFELVWCVRGGHGVDPLR